LKEVLIGNSKKEKIWGESVVFGAATGGGGDRWILGMKKYLS
jgi:hypothetical protein